MNLACDTGAVTSRRLAGRGPGHSDRVKLEVAVCGVQAVGERSTLCWPLCQHNC